MLGAGHSVETIVAGDFNRDGKLDFAAADYTAGVRIFLGDGAGGFTAFAGSPMGVGSEPNAVVAGDFDRDGNLDLAVANSADANVSILLGDGAGGFSAASGSPVSVGDAPVGIAVGDFSGDGKLDLAVANQGGDNVTILLGNGLGGFAAASGSPVAAGDEPLSVSAGDFNRDGKLDLAVVNITGKTVSILLGNGAGGFSAASPLSFDSSVYFAAIGDFDGDGKADLAVSEFNAWSVGILLNSCGSVPCVATTTDADPASTASGYAVTLRAFVYSTSTVTSGSVKFSVDGVEVGTAPVVNGTATLPVAN